MSKVRVLVGTRQGSVYSFRPTASAKNGRSAAHISPAGEIYHLKVRPWINRIYCSQTKRLVRPNHSAFDDGGKNWFSQARLPAKTKRRTERPRAKAINSNTMSQKNRRAAPTHQFTTALSIPGNSSASGISSR